MKIKLVTLFFALFSACLLDLISAENRSVQALNYEISKTTDKKELSDSALQYGKQQVQKMLANRPAMSKYVTRNGVEKRITEEDSLWQWAVRKFAGEDLSDTIDWNPDPPDKAEGINSDYGIPTVNSRGYIRVRDIYSGGWLKGKKVSFEDLWNCAVFELLNIANADKFLKVYSEAIKGNLTKEEFVKKNTEIEFETVKEVKQFYKSVWVLWASKNNFTLHSFSKFQQVMLYPDSYDAYKEFLYKIGGKSYFDYWENYYDKSIVPYLQTTESYKNKSTIK